MAPKTQKALDLTRAYAGTCQACFNVQVAKGKGQLTLVLHGYSRPGHGWIVGDCGGHGELPYELSCEYTKAWRKSVKDSLANLRAALKRLREDSVDTLYVEVDVPQAERKDRWKHETKIIGIGRDYIDPEASMYAGKPRDFEYYRQRKISEKEMYESQMVSALRFLDEKISSWRYAPEALVEHDTYVANIARKSKEEAAAVRKVKNDAKAMKALGTAFRYVGQAVSRHKKGCRNGNYSGATFELQVDNLAHGYNIWTTDDFTDRSARHTELNRVKNVAELEAQSLAPFAEMYPSAVKKGKR